MFNMMQPAEQRGLQNEIPPTELDLVCKRTRADSVCECCTGWKANPSGGLALGLGVGMGICCMFAQP